MEALSQDNSHNLPEREIAAQFLHVRGIRLWLSFDTWSHMEATQIGDAKYFLQARQILPEAADVNFQD